MGGVFVWGEEAELDRTWEFLIASYGLTVGSVSPREEYEPSLETYHFRWGAAPRQLTDLLGGEKSRWE